MKNVLKLLAKNILIPLGLTTAASAAGAGIHKEIFGQITTALIILNGEVKNTIKLVQSLGESGLLIKGVSKTTENKAKKKKVRFLACYQVDEVLVYSEICQKANV